MSESSSAIRNGPEFFGVGLIVGLLNGPEWHAGIEFLSGGRMLLTRSRGGGLAKRRWGGHASKQAGKALRLQGQPHRTKRSRILATLQQNKGMYEKNTSGYVHRWVKP